MHIGVAAALLGLGWSALAPAATLVVANKSDATVSLVDLDRREVVATLPTGAGPHEVAVSPNGRLAVVSNYGTREAPGSSLTLLDVPGARVMRTIELGAWRRPHGLAWLDDDVVLVTVESSRACVAVDTRSGTVVRQVITDQEVSHMVAVAPGGARAFVANIGSGTVTAIDPVAGVKLRDLATGAGAEGIAITPDGRQVWVTNRAADTVTVLDAASLEVAAQLESPAFPIRAAATPDGRHVLITNARSGDLAVFATAAPALVRRVELPGEASGSGHLFGDVFGRSSVPIGVVVARDGGRAYVAHTAADFVSVVDLATWQVVGRLTAGREPDGMAWSPLPVRP